MDRRLVLDAIWALANENLRVGSENGFEAKFLCYEASLPPTRELSNAVSIVWSRDSLGEAIYGIHANTNTSPPVG